jgi:hypothetical protein
LLTGNVMVYLVGVPRLVHIRHKLEETYENGLFHPFVPGDIFKLYLGAPTRRLGICRPCGTDLMTPSASTWWSEC